MSRFIRDPLSPGVFYNANVFSGAPDQAPGKITAWDSRVKDTPAVRSFVGLPARQNSGLVAMSIASTHSGVVILGA